MMEVLTHQEPHNPKAERAHKDKLAETKKQNAAIHEAKKLEEKLQKEAKEQKNQDLAKHARVERALKLQLEPEGQHGKRAIKEQRELIKQAEKTTDDQLCSHGVQGCRICFPHRAEVDKHHEHKRELPLGASAELEEGEE